MNIRDILAINLRWHRKNQNLSQSEIAVRARVDRTSISNLERSQCAATIDIVERLAEALKLSVTDLFIHPELRQKPKSLRVLPTFEKDNSSTVSIPLSILPLSECAAFLLSFFAYPECNSNIFHKRMLIEQSVLNSFMRSKVDADPDWGFGSHILRPAYLLMSEKLVEKSLKDFRKQANSRFAVAHALGKVIGNDAGYGQMKNAPEEGYPIHLTKIAADLSELVGEKDVKNILVRVWSPGFSVVHLAMAINKLHLHLDQDRKDNLTSIIKILSSDRYLFDFVLKTASDIREMICSSIKLRGNSQSLLRFKAI